MRLRRAVLEQVLEDDARRRGQAVHAHTESVVQRVRDRGERRHDRALTDAAHTVGLHLDPPAGQIRKTITSGLRAGARRPRSVTA